MVLQYTVHLVPLSLAVFLAAVGAGMAWKRRKGPVEVWGTLSQVGAGAWALVMLLLVSFTGRGPKLFAVSLFLPVGMFTSVSFFVFTVHFVGRSEWLSRDRLGLLFLLPVLTVCIAFTNEFHRFVFDSVTVVETGGVDRLTYSREPGFYALAGVTYVFNVAFLALLFQQVLRSRNVYRKISLVLFVSLFVLDSLVLVSVFGLSPLPHFTLFPYAYLLLGGFLIAGTTSVQFLRRLPLDQMLSPFRSASQGQIPTARATVMQEVDSGIITLDADGIIVDINTMAKKMIGADRPVGSHLREAASADQIKSDATVQAVLDSRDGLRELSEEVWVEAGEAERCYAVTITSLSEDSDDSGFVVLLHDITEQKRREQALRERERELEAQNARLERQKKQLEHQNERLDRFASIVSHDLRNPLNVAKGHVSMIAETVDAASDPPVNPESATQSLDSLNRMEAIIDDALTLARQGKAITETNPVELGELIASSWSNVETRDASLTAPEGVTVRADAGRLRNVFENLFRNSIEHGRDDVSITVGLLNDGFFVEDDGPGIDEDRREQVFEEGYTTSDEGTGFGLAIVSDVVRAHGWDVRATRSEAGGVRFEVTGVAFPWSREALVSEFDDVLETERAEQVVHDAMADACLSRDKFDRETAMTLLDDISSRLDDQRARSVAAEIAQQVRDPAD